MTIPQSLALGVVQGVTEFFPISSSGHLVILQGIFGMKEPQLAFDIFLHLGTLISILIYFRRDIVKLLTGGRKILWYIVVASAPTFIIGLMLNDAVEEIFTRPHVVAYMMIATGVWLVAATLYGRPGRAGWTKKVGFLNSLLIGVSQGLAVIPGISRSGSTIGAGILSGIGREEAFRFSFLIAIPAILGASLFKAVKIGSAFASGECLHFLAGGFAAMIAGLVSVGVLSKMVRSNKLYIFGIYCILAASVILTVM